jgi:hypothetical protein
MLDSPPAGAQVGLTIAGMRPMRQMASKVEMFLDALQYLVQKERSFDPSPTQVQTVVATSTEIGAHLATPSPRRHITPTTMSFIRDQLQTEPSTWSCQIPQPLADEWTVRLSPFLRRYVGLLDADDYVQRVIEQISPAAVGFPVLYPTGLALPEAIDYLNAVWRLRCQQPLFRVSRAESAAKLALPCNGADEFDARLSALCSIIDVANLPDRPENKLTDLATYLSSQLPEDSSYRTAEAIDDLRAIFDLRVWRQHSGTEGRLRRGMRRLGVELPTYDWDAAWNLIAHRCVAALNAIREEAEGLGTV